MSNSRCEDYHGYQSNRVVSTRCEAGYLCRAGVTEKCPAGQYSSAGSSSCSFCPPGQFSPQEGATNCTCCEGGMESTHAKQSCDYCPENEVFSLHFYFTLPELIIYFYLSSLFACLFFMYLN